MGDNKMKIEDKHKWDVLPKDNGGNKRWKCRLCGCEKILGNYKFAEPDYSRSGQITSYRPNCVDMGRRSSELLD